MTYYNHDLNPIAFSIGDFVFPWYWLVYFFGYVSTYLTLDIMSRKGKLAANRADVYDYMLWGTLGLLLGSRLTYVFVYNFSYFSYDWHRVYQIHRGGMSFHGALIGVALAIIILAKRKKHSIFLISDVAVFPLSIALLFGRIANFINGELAGRPSDVPWAVVFANLYDHQPRHPSQLYEAFFEGAIMFLILFILRSKLASRGVLSMLFVFCYGFFRFFIEFFRVPDAQLGLYGDLLSMGQILCIIMIIVGGVGYFKCSKRSAAESYS